MREVTRLVTAVEADRGRHGIARLGKATDRLVVRVQHPDVAVHDDPAVPLSHPCPCPDRHLADDGPAVRVDPVDRVRILHPFRRLALVPALAVTCTPCDSEGGHQSPDHQAHGVLLVQIDLHRPMRRQSDEAGIRALLIGATKP